MAGESPFFEDRPFELLRELVPSSPLTSEIIFRADELHKPHIDRIELGSFAGQRFLIKKERFDR